MEGRAQWPLWGGQATLIVRGHDLKGAREAVDSVVMAVDVACSRFRPDSELVRLAVAGGQRQAVSPLLADLVSAALRAAELTQGAVDPTVGSALLDAGYAASRSGPTQPRWRMPASPVRVAASWRDVDLDVAAGTLRTPPGVLVDLGATAKARAADLAAAAAYAATGEPVLVGLCGDVAVAGTPVDKPWTVQVLERPDDADGPLVELYDGGVATSSTQVRRWLRHGSAMHHLIDPRTGLPVKEFWRTATVAAASCLDANIASTATVVKSDRGLAWLEATGLPARLVASDGSVRGLGGWPADCLQLAS
jgi:FAD:protein FMN transferase